MMFVMAMVLAVLVLVMRIVPTPQDAELSLQESITKAVTFSGDALDLGSGREFSPGRPITVVVDVSAIDTADGDETYSFKLEESADNNAWTDASAAKAATAVGVLTFPATLTKRYQRLTVTIAGTTPSVTYAGWINPMPA